MRIYIVTDSYAHFNNPHFVEQNSVCVVPNTITIDGQKLRDGVDITAEEAFKRIEQADTPPRVDPPTTQNYIDVYGELSRNADAIISIHASRQISASWEYARLAAQRMMGHCEIVVIDSQSLCAAQAMLVDVAVQAARQDQTLDEIIRTVRGAVDRLYAVYYVESVDFLLNSQIMSHAHSILGTMLGIKPFLAIEDGRIVPIEKVRTRSQALERLFEFAAEFTDIDDAIIMQSQPYITEHTRNLQDRLAQEFPAQQFPFTVYGPSLAAMIGTDAMGMAVLESEELETDMLQDDF